MRTLNTQAAGAAALTFCFSTLCLAQTIPTTPLHNQVVVIHLKADMVNEWVDLQKNELIPAQKKGGVKSRSTYQTVYGNTNEYLIVTPLEKYALADDTAPQTKILGTEAAARLNAKLSKCIESRQVYISNPLPDHGNDSGDIGVIGVFTRRRVAAGRMDDYLSLIKTQIMPVYKKVSQNYTVNRRGLGADSNDVTTVSWVKKMADLDLGPTTIRVLGAPAATKLNASVEGMTTLMEQIVRRRVPELSFAATSASIP